MDIIRSHVVAPSIDYVTSKMTPFGMATASFAGYDLTRASKDLIKNVNQAYSFFKHCKTLDYDRGKYSRVPHTDVRERYRVALDDMSKFLKTAFNHSFLTRFLASIRGAFASDIQSDIDLFKLNLREFKDKYESKSPLGTVSKFYSPLIIIAYPDWYRYELNILATNLLMMVSEMNLVVTKTKID
jgi:hypothetical protein